MLETISEDLLLFTVYSSVLPGERLQSWMWNTADHAVPCQPHQPQSLSNRMALGCLCDDVGDRSLPLFCVVENVCRNRLHQICPNGYWNFHQLAASRSHYLSFSVHLFLFFSLFTVSESVSSGSVSVCVSLYIYMSLSFSVHLFFSVLLWKLPDQSAYLQVHYCECTIFGWSDPCNT